LRIFGTKMLKAVFQTKVVAGNKRVEEFSLRGTS
jgi:hypothetical protein